MRTEEAQLAGQEGKGQWLVVGSPADALAWPCWPLLFLFPAFEMACHCQRIPAAACRDMTEECLGHRGPGGSIASFDRPVPRPPTLGPWRALRCHLPRPLLPAGAGHQRPTANGQRGCRGVLPCRAAMSGATRALAAAHCLETWRGRCLVCFLMSCGEGTRPRWRLIRSTVSLASNQLACLAQQFS